MGPEKVDPKVLIVTPTYNERDNLPEFVSAVHASAPAAHVLVVDDDSPDGTGALGDALAAGDARVAVLHRPGKLGLGTAYVDGFRHALRHGYDVVFEMDADLSHDPAYIPRFLEAIAAGADLVLGSRNVAGGGVEGWGLDRHVLSKGGSLYARTILGVGIRDMTTGFKAYTRRALEVIGPESIRSNGYSFQIETTYRAVRKGLSVVEVPIVFVDRRAGHSKMSRRIFAEAITEVWRLRADALLGRI
jgi:dolichol-phosphate mannosyltransferase